MTNFPVDEKAMENLRQVVERTTNLVVVDMDGTLSIVNPERLHLIPAKEHQGCTKAWEPFNLAARYDIPNWHIVRLVRALYAAGWTVVIATVRGDSARGVSYQWLRDHAIPHHALLMRSMGDVRPSAEVKRDMYKMMGGSGRIALVIDDEQPVIDAATELNLCALKIGHYAPGY